MQIHQRADEELTRLKYIPSRLKLPKTKTNKKRIIIKVKQVLGLKQ